MSKSRETLLALVGALVLAVVHCWPLTEKLDNLGISDWDQHLTFHAVPRRTITHYGQVPLWNPYNSGGLPDIGNPQSRILSPTFLLILQFGTLPGIRLDIALHCAMAFFFTWCLARRMGASPIASALGAATYGFSGLFVYPVVFGMTWSLAIAYVPLALLGFVKGIERPFASWIAGLALALMLFAGGAYVFVLAAAFLGIYAAATAIQLRSVKPFLVMGLTFLFAAGFSGPKLFPALEFMAAHPRQMDDQSGYSIWGLYFSLFDRNQHLATRWEFSGEGIWDGIYYFFDENFMYVTIPAGLFFLAGILTWGRRQWPLLVTMAILLWLCLGTLARPLSLWDWAHGLPVFKSMRVAQRFRIPMMSCFAVFTALGMDTVLTWFVNLRMDTASARDRWARGLAAVLTSLIVLELIAVNGSMWTWAFNVPKPPMIGRPIFRQVSSAANYDLYGYITEPKPPLGWKFKADTGLLPAFVSNLGILNANESALFSTDPMLLTTHVVPAGDPRYRGEVYIDGGPGNTIYTMWSPNRLEVSIDSDGPGILVVNQNWDKGWKCEDGRPVVRYFPPILAESRPDVGGVIAARITAADKRVTFIYDPASFKWGLAVFAVTVLTTAGLGMWSLTRKKRQAF